MRYTNPRLLYFTLQCRGNYSATSNSMKSGCSRSRPRPLIVVPNVTAHPSTASAPITVLQYNGPLLCSFNMSVHKGLNETTIQYFFELFTLAVWHVLAPCKKMVRCTMTCIGNGVYRVEYTPIEVGQSYNYVIYIQCGIIYRRYSCGILIAHYVTRDGDLFVASQKFLF